MMILMATGLLVLAIVVPIQVLSPEHQGALGLIVFLAIVLAQGLLEVLRRWKPAKGTNGDIVRTLEGIRSEQAANVACLAELTRRIEDNRLDDEREAMRRHGELLRALNRMSA